MDDISDAQVAEIKAGKEKLMASAQKLFTKVYEQAGAAQEPQVQAGRTQDAGRTGYGDDVVDGDYKEV